MQDASQQDGVFGDPPQQRRPAPPAAPVPVADQESALDPDLEAAWSEACTGIYRVLKRGRGVVGRGADGPALSEAQVAALESVAQSGPLPVGVVAARAGIAQPTLTRMLNLLEKQGVVRRTPDPSDLRSVFVDLTDEGRELWSAKHELLRFWQRDALLRFAPEERVLAVDVLARLVAIIEDQIRDR